MLILQRKNGESLSINNNITLTVMDIGADWVKLAIDAPKEIPILRSELKEAADFGRFCRSLIGKMKNQSHPEHQNGKPGISAFVSCPFHCCAEISLFKTSIAF